MCKKIIIGLLLSAYISTPTATSTPLTANGNISHHTPAMVQDKSLNSTVAKRQEEISDEKTAMGQDKSLNLTISKRQDETSVTRDQPLSDEKTGSRKQFVHSSSEPIIIVIIFGVMAGIIGTILLLAYGVGRLSEKSSRNVQPTFSHDTEVALSSIETGNPEN